MSKKYGDSTHGEVDLQQALNVSCNHFFGEIGIIVGDKHLRQTVLEFGIGYLFLSIACRSVRRLCIARSRQHSIVDQQWSTGC